MTSKEPLSKLSTAQEYFETAKKHNKAGFWGKAIHNYRQAISIEPDMFQAYFELGKILEKDQKEAAILNYIKTISINPEFQPVYYRFFWLDLNSEQVDKIVKCCRKAMEACRQTPSFSVICQTVGELLSRQGDITEATTFYREAMNYQLSSTYPQLITNPSDVKLEQKKPSFLIIGGMKCGTTSLYSYLSKHPQVVPALKKEIHYFTKEFDRGTDWYLSHFPTIPSDSELITGEATPCMTVENVEKRIHQSFPNLKFVVILRDPVARAYSHHNHVVKFFGVKKKFSEIIKHDLDDIETRQLMLDDDDAYLKINCSYLSKGLYYFWLKKWLSLFPREQFLIITNDELSQNTSNVVKKTCDFLDLPYNSVDDYSKKLVGSYKPMDPELKKALDEYYLPFNQKLESFLKMKLNF